MNMRIPFVTFLLIALVLTAQAADKPNFVFIFADDMGWTGTSVEMIPGDPRTKSDYYLTPNLEKLARRLPRSACHHLPAFQGWA